VVLLLVLLDRTWEIDLVVLVVVLVVVMVLLLVLLDRT